jgi:hypothetical protein
MDWTKDTEHYRKKYLIPKPLQGKVCMCDEPASTVGKEMNCCAKCLLPYRWYVRICTVCKQHFIKDFRRKAVDCVKHARCWDCTSTTAPCDCDKEETLRVDFGPLGLNPRKFTREELKGTFSFDSPF